VHRTAAPHGNSSLAAAPPHSRHLQKCALASRAAQHAAPGTGYTEFVSSGGAPSLKASTEVRAREQSGSTRRTGTTTDGDSEDVYRSKMPVMAIRSLLASSATFALYVSAVMAL